ncbi:MAG: LysM peptidoglycan-binding domain-containing protein [Alphaproteobacteria bacterium]|nr:LysM peptidoglycan-binding domain-containing protein [Alphaproteobacteria bacterium]
MTSTNNNNNGKQFNARLLQTRLAAMKAENKQPAAQTAAPKPEAKDTKDAKPETKTAAPAQPKEIRVNPLTQALRKAHINPKSWRNILAYWFPIVIVVGLAAFAIYHFSGCQRKPSDNVTVMNEQQLPEFDMVRTQPGGGLVVAGRFIPGAVVQIEVNKKVIGRETCSRKGEFAFSTSSKFKPGNYIVRLLSEDGNLASKDSVFVYIASEKDGASLSLLMTESGSKFLQAPKSSDNALSITKIDYFARGRLRIQGQGLPRLNVGATFNGQPIGAGKVADNRTFGFDATFNDFQANKNYTIEIKMTDDLGNVVDVVSHSFNMPESKPGEAAYYTVKKGDNLWVISRRHYGRGILYTQIFDANRKKIKDPHWIFPKQIFLIP